MTEIVERIGYEIPLTYLEDVNPLFPKPAPQFAPQHFWIAKQSSSGSSQYWLVFSGTFSQLAITEIPGNAATDERR